MAKLYPINVETFPDSENREVLYVVASGQIIAHSVTTLSLATGEQAKITAGDWATKTVTLAGFHIAELRNGNLKLGTGGNPELIGPKTYTNVKPV